MAEIFQDKKPENTFLLHRSEADTVVSEVQVLCFQLFRF